MRNTARIISTLAFTAAGDLPAMAGPMPPTPCYDRSCARVEGPVRYVPAETSGQTSDLRTEMSVDVVRVELEPIDVRIPRPPYGVTGSGLCLLRFSVETDGRVSDLNIARCPDAYAAHIRESSADWLYAPVKSADGTPQRTPGVSMTLPWASQQVSVTTYD